MKRSFSYTLIKRSHLVMQYGVGSVIRTRQGITALVAGLHEWNFTLTKHLRQGETPQNYVRQYSFKESELTDATGVARFLPPPAYDDNAKNWELPLIRFPLAGVCSHWTCRVVTYADHGSRFTKNWKCERCAKTKKARVQQVPVFLACPKGHLDEIIWDDVVDHEGGCTGGDVAVSFGARIEHPTVRCLTCKGTGTPQQRGCTGARPWLPTAGNEPCDEAMDVVSRSSVKAYYPMTKSALHIPVEDEIDELLLDWLLRTNWAAGRSVATASEREAIATALGEVGWSVTSESAAVHILRAQADNHTDDEWDPLEARLREFEVLAHRRRYASLSKSELLRMQRRELHEFESPYIGSGKLIIGVTAVHKMTESRVLNGFTRIEPRQVPPREGRLLMWGNDTDQDSWLPGYRTHGEGIFLELEPNLLGNPGAHTDPEARELFKLSKAGRAAHTLAHLIINLLGRDSGYSVPSIRDRIYDLGGGRLGLLVYTAEGDSMGTLGGLVAFCEPGRLEPLVAAALDSAQWCPQDPVCRETTLDLKRSIHASCHQCALLPETSCELFNGDLDRRLLLQFAAPAGATG